MSGPYRRNALIVHRDVKPANMFERAKVWWRRYRRHLAILRAGTWRMRFIRCSLCMGPLAQKSDGRGSSGPRRQMPNAYHLHNKCEPRRSLRTFRKIIEGETVSPAELKRALGVHEHWRRMANAFPEFMPASADARRKLLEHFGLEIPSGDYRTVNEVRAAMGLPTLPPEPRAGDGSDDPWGPGAP